MKNLYCVYDKVAGVYNAPFVAENDETAIRAFNHAMSNSPFSQDMSLYRLGVFHDDSDGSISALDKPDFICNYSAKVGE